jgi:hypothetical protein
LSALISGAVGFPMLAACRGNVEGGGMDTLPDNGVIITLLAIAFKVEARLVADC